MQQLTHLWRHAGFQKYFQNTSWMFAAKIFSMIASLVATIVVARSLGPESYGQLAYALSFVSIFGFIASLGIDSILYRELVKNPENQQQLLGSAIFLKFFGGLIAMALTIVFGFYFGQDDVSKLLIGILSGTFIFIAFQSIGLEFQARVKSKYPSLIQLTINLILNAGKILIVVAGGGVIYLALLLFLEPILYVGFYGFAYEKILGKKIFSLSFDKKICFSLLGDSWPLIFTNAFGLIYARIDQVMIKNMVGATAVGIYSSAVSLAEVWYFLPVTIITSLFPAIVNAKKNSIRLYYQRMGRLALFLIIVAVLTSILVMFVAPLAIQIIYGSAFSSASLILKIYVWACVGTFLTYLVNSYLITENNKKGLLIVTFVPMILNVVLNLLWISRYGIVGSAYATLISYSVAPLSVLLLKQVRQELIKR